VLKHLKDRNIKATFFVVGSMVLQYPEVLIETYKAGHEIGIHTWSHPSLVEITADQVIVEMMWTARIIREVIGYTPTLVRPPCNFFLLKLRWRD
jgi:peptidoglycan/xylan/chitin deacetylase (PgdA/CDA1 family)